MNVELTNREVEVGLRGRLAKSSFDWQGTGVVTKVVDGVAVVFGLTSVSSGDIIDFETPVGKIKGMVLSLQDGTVDIVILGNDSYVKEDTIVHIINEVINIPVGFSLLGRIIDPLGRPLDGKGDLEGVRLTPIEVKAPGIVVRYPVEEPVITGLKVVDNLIPIGRGQRELIIGDRQIGKTTIAIDTILNQCFASSLTKSQQGMVYCIYVAIGQKKAGVAGLVNLFKKTGVLDQTVIVSATAADSCSLQFLAPYAGAAVGEFFRDAGEHAVVIYDDLSKHAKAYRQMSLLLRRPPGREAYPGDVFYLHSRLLERAAKMHVKLGGGSLTALPIVETENGDVSAYIPTNVISITDGQIFLDTGLFYRGIKPAINLGLSVSRVGSKAQFKSLKMFSNTLKLELARYREIEEFLKFADDFDAETQAIISRGITLTELLKQEKYEPKFVYLQIFSMFTGIKGFIDSLRGVEIFRFESELLSFLEYQFTSKSFLHQMEENNITRYSFLPGDVFKNIDYFTKYCFS